MEELVKSSERLSFVFGGENTIDADVLTASLSSLVNAYRSSLIAQYPENEATVSINVCAFAEGSFDVQLESIIQLFPMVATSLPQAVECAKNFLEIIQLKRNLKGKKPSSVETENGMTRIVNAEGETNYFNSTVYNVFVNTPSIDGALSAVFDPLVSKPRPKVTIKTSKGNIEIPQKEFETMRIPIVDELEPIDSPKLETIVEEQLLLKSPDFLGNSKWSFHYDGKTIRAAIEDDTFMENVKRGKVKLSAGVRLPVKMLIQVYMNEKLDIERKVYIILEVTGDVIEPNDTDAEQLNLF